MRSQPLIVRVLAICCVVVASPAWSAMGRTPGIFETTANGAASYTIPIFAPLGPQGMQPDVALVYDSNGGVGSMGRGWSIAGLSAITRCAKTISQDGVASSIQLANSDGYCLDGNRLRLTGGTYGQVYSTYQTEIADFSLVTVTNSQSDGPLSFTVKGKDGRYYDYGTDGNSRVFATGTSTPTTWMLREIRDRSNNRVRITYAAAATGLEGMTHPVQIDWAATTHNGSSFQYSMLFTYGANVPESSPYGFVAGTTVTDNQLLAAISVTNGGSVVKKYVLTYNTSPTTGAKRLGQVKECSDNAETDCLLPSTIGYQDGQAGVASSASSGPVAGIYDINGDGFPDGIIKSGNQWQVTWGTQSGAGGSTVVVATTSSNEVALVGDVRGVGQADVLVAQGSVWWVYAWNGSSFSSASTGAPASGYPISARLADVDGDGRKDLVYFWGASSAGGGAGYRLSTSSANAVSFSGSTTTAFTMAGLSWCGDSCVFLSGASSMDLNYNFDYNGDGKVDFLGALSMDLCYPNEWECLGWYVSSQVYLFVSQPSGGYSATLWLSYDGQVSPNFRLLAVNDDACTDLTLDEGSGAYVVISPCNGVPTQTLYPSGAIKAVMDWDGDGRRDLLVWPYSGSTLWVQRSLGNGYATPVNTNVSCAGGGCEWVAVDRNGDGLDDLENPTLSGGTSYYLHNGAGIRPDLATSFADGYGVTQTVSYVSAAWNNYTRGSSAVSPNYDFQGSFPLVASATSSDGIGGTYTLSYLYSGAAWNRQGRGLVVSPSGAGGRKLSSGVITRLLGAQRRPAAPTPTLDGPDFSGVSSRRVTDSRTGAYTIDYYERAFPYSGSLVKTESYQSSNQLISVRDIALGHTVLDSTANNQRYFIYPTDVLTRQYEVGGTANGNLITQFDVGYVYDLWGNVTTAGSVLWDKDVNSPNYNYAWYQEVTNTFNPDNGSNWCLGLPTGSSVTNWATNGEDGVTRSQTFSPDYTNCRIEQYSVGSGNRQVVTWFAFDSFGNPSTVMVTGRDSGGATMANRTTYINWGSANGEVDPIF